MDKAVIRAGFVLLCLISILLTAGIIQRKALITEFRLVRGLFEQAVSIESSKFQYVTLTAYTGKKLTATMQIVRSECLDYSGTNTETCSSCNNFKTTRNLLLGKKEK